MENKTIDLELLDFYRLLVANLRYSYSRNNHLQPSSTYQRVKEEYLPKLFAIDKETALHTFKQICEECIFDEICMNFYDGEEDESGNRRSSLEFVEYLLNEIHKYEPDWLPYNYDQFIKNKNLDDEPIYLIYEIKGNRKKLISDKKYSTNYYFEGLLREILHLSENDLEQGVFYHRQRIPNSFVDKRNNKHYKRFDDYIYEIKEPINRKFYIKNTRNDRFKKSGVKND